MLCADIAHHEYIPDACPVGEQDPEMNVLDPVSKRAYTPGGFSTAITAPHVRWTAGPKAAASSNQLAGVRSAGLIDNPPGQTTDLWRAYMPGLVFIYRPPGPPSAGNDVAGQQPGMKSGIFLLWAIITYQQVQGQLQIRLPLWSSGKER
jgi:hypothetical protein